MDSEKTNSVDTRNAAKYDENSIYFLGVKEFDLLSSKNYNLLVNLEKFNDFNKEEVWRSYANDDLYYSITGDRVYPLPVVEGGVKHAFTEKFYIVLRKKTLPVMTLESLTENVLNCPISRVQFNGGPELGDKILVYKFQNLTVLQADYIRDLCHCLHEQEDEFCDSNFPDWIVTEIGLEEGTTDSGSLGLDDYYLTVVARKLEKYAEKKRSLEIEIDVPVDDAPDSSENNGEAGVGSEDAEGIEFNEDGEKIIKFNIGLKLVAESRFT